MIVYLVRHAIALDRRTSKVPDEDRPLTPQGVEKMKSVVRGLRVIGVAPDLVLTSPLRRTRETAAIVAKGLGRAEIEDLPALAPGGTASTVLTALRRRAKLRSVALVGHRPEISELAAFLLTGSPASAPTLPFKKGAVACISVDVGGPKKRASLEWFLTPKMLRLVSASAPDS